MVTSEVIVPCNQTYVFMHRMLLTKKLRRCVYFLLPVNSQEPYHVIFLHAFAKASFIAIMSENISRATRGHRLSNSCRVSYSSNSNSNPFVFVVPFNFGNLYVCNLGLLTHIHLCVLNCCMFWDGWFGTPHHFLGAPLPSSQLFHSTSTSSIFFWNNWVARNKMEKLKNNTLKRQQGDSKCPFHPLVGGHLTPWKGHLTIPKRSLWITRSWIIL